jgi:hypothetical protein
MPKQFRIPLLASAATKTVLEDPLFSQVLEHWREIAGRIIVVVPKGVKCPEVKKIRYQQVPSDVPTLGDVITQVSANLDYVVNRAAIVEPYSVFKWDLSRIDEITERRQLSLSWMATAHPVRLADFDTPTGIDETCLSFFMAPESIWNFIVNREIPDYVPFIAPAWSGWLANWSSHHVHTHKYHDISDLRAIGLLEDAPIEEVSLDGLGPLTFNAPIRNYIRPAKRG